MTTTATLPKILYKEWEKLELVASDLVEQIDGGELSHRSCEEYRQLVLARGLQNHGLPEWIDEVVDTEEWYQKISEWPCAYVSGEEDQ